MSCSVRGEAVTKKEMTEIFSVMLLAWPNAEMFKGGVAKLGPTIELWTACLSDVDFWLGQQAVIRLCRECKFPPSIAEFREKAESVKGDVARQIDQAWSYLHMMIKTMDATPLEAYIDSPAMTKAAIDAMGGSDKLIITEPHTMGDGSQGPHKMFNYDGFRYAYEQLLRRKSALPGRSSPAVGSGGIKQIGGNVK